MSQEPETCTCPRCREKRSTSDLPPGQKYCSWCIKDLETQRAQEGATVAVES